MAEPRKRPRPEEAEDEEDALLRLMTEPLDEEGQHLVAEAALEDEAGDWRQGDNPFEGQDHVGYTFPGGGQTGDETTTYTVPEGQDRGVWAEWDPDDFAPAIAGEDGMFAPVQRPGNTLYNRVSEDPTMGADDPEMGPPGLMDRILDALLGRTNTFYSPRELEQREKRPHYE